MSDPPLSASGRRAPRLSGAAWAAIAVTAGFIAVTWWWLTQDQSIPIYDAGFHLDIALKFQHWFEVGSATRWFTLISPYPPLAYLPGTAAALIGGAGVAQPIIGENLVFVPLLTLGCYQTGRLLFGRRAGLLAAIFVLGSPLLIAQLHVFMLDAPETALVAVSMWLLLATDDFSRTRVAAWAGLAVGLGLMTKAQFPQFVAGIALVALVRGGWRNWRGLAAFAAVALIIAAPWYVYHRSELSTIVHLAGPNLGGAPPGNYPARFSTANLTWYFWSTLNSQLLAPLFLLACGGVVWTVRALARNKIGRGPVIELLAGGLVAWLALTLTPHHDIRYDMPLMPYIAVIATGWIVHLPRVARFAAIFWLVLAVGANTLATTFGVGGVTEIKLVASPPGNTEAFPDRVVLYSSAGFLVAGPQRDGDVPRLLGALRPDGVRLITFNQNAGGGPPDFSTAGLEALSRIAHLLPVPTPAFVRTDPEAAALVHGPVAPGAPRPCTLLDDGTGVWVIRLEASTHKLTTYCPVGHPRYDESVAAEGFAAAALQ